LVDTVLSSISNLYEEIEEEGPNSPSDTD